MKKILITSNPGFYNKGDAALIVGTIETLKIIGEVEVNLVSSNPEFDSARCDANIINVGTYSSKFPLFNALRFAIENTEHLIFAIMYRIIGWKKIPKYVQRRVLLSKYLESDIIVTALDDSFTTLYGPHSFSENIRTILFATILNKPVVLYGGSVGPFKNKIFEIIGKYFINKCTLITLREEISLEYLKNIGVNKAPMYVTADLAFYLKSVSKTKAREILHSEGIFEDHYPLIGVSLSRVISQWAFPELEKQEEKYTKYLQIMAEIMDYLIENIHAKIIFIPQVIGPTKERDDRITANKICILMKNKSQVVLINNEYKPEELRSITGLFDLLISARTHAAISAAIECVPFIALEYKSHKTRGIMGKMLDCDDLVYNIQDLDFDTLKSEIEVIWNRRQEIKEELQIKTKDIFEKSELNGFLLKEIVTTT